MRKLILPLAALLLAACVGTVRQADVASFDLGTAAIAWKPAQPAIGRVEVTAPSWLGGHAIQYRLLYADAMRRSAYGESRWAAEPAELVERALNRQAAAGGCRLRLELDELIQVFDAPAASRVLLDARATLVAPRSETVLAARAFSVVRPAPSADARGGVAASAAAVQGLAGEVADWLAAQARATPAIIERCTGA